MLQFLIYNLQILKRFLLQLLVWGPISASTFRAHADFCFNRLVRMPISAETFGAQTDFCLSFGAHADFGLNVWCAGRNQHKLLVRIPISASTFGAHAQIRFRFWCACRIQLKPLVRRRLLS